MTKYNKSNIMKRAWAEAKGEEMSTEEKVLNEIEKIVAEATKVYNYEISSRLWENYGKSRTYFKVVETRSTSKHYVTYDFGFIDNQTGEYHAGKMDAFGKWTLAGNRRAA